MPTMTSSDKLNAYIRKGGTALLIATEKGAGQQLRTLASKPDTDDDRLALRVVINRISSELMRRGLTHCWTCQKWGTHEDGTCKTNPQA